MWPPGPESMSCRPGASPVPVNRRALGTHTSEGPSPIWAALVGILPGRWWAGLNTQVTAALFDRAGALRSAYDAVDWAATSIGPVGSWGESLRHAVEVMLGSRFPMNLFWGPQFVVLYNEAYVELIADKHPAALGTPARAVFPEAWDGSCPLIESVYDGGAASWVEDELVPLYRSGFLEECYFPFSYSPVRGPGGVIEGVLD